MNAREMLEASEDMAMAERDALNRERFEPPNEPTDEEWDRRTRPGPGIYEGVPASDYHRWPWLSNSRLKPLRRSPAHLREHLLNPPGQTEDMLIGSAVDALIFEPDTFEAMYRRAPEGDRRTKAVKEAWEIAQAEFPRASFLKSEAWDDVFRIRDALKAHPAASSLLNLPGGVQTSAVWDDPETGVRCKMRLDKYAEPVRTIVDLKTTGDAGRDAFTRTIFNFGYHRQGAMYLDGLAKNGVEARRFALIAVEKKPPYGVAVYRLRDDAIDLARTEIEELLQTYRDCMATGNYPAYSPEIEDVSVPRWAWSTAESDF